MNTDINELFSKYGIQRHPSKRQSSAQSKGNGQKTSNSIKDQYDQTSESSDLVITQYPSNPTRPTPPHPPRGEGQEVEGQGHRPLQGPEAERSPARRAGPNGKRV